jgi:hypothetical protein
MGTFGLLKHRENCRDNLPKIGIELRAAKFRNGRDLGSKVDLGPGLCAFCLKSIRASSVGFSTCEVDARRYAVLVSGFRDLMKWAEKRVDTKRKEHP